MNLDSTTILLILIPITLVIGAIAAARMIKRNANDDSLFEDDSDEPRVPNKEGANYKTIYFLIPLLVVIVWVLVAELWDSLFQEELVIYVPEPENMTYGPEEPGKIYIAIDSGNNYLFKGKVISEVELGRIFKENQDKPVVLRPQLSTAS